MSKKRYLTRSNSIRQDLDSRVKRLLRCYKWLEKGTPTVEAAQALVDDAFTKLMEFLDDPTVVKRLDTVLTQIRIDDQSFIESIRNFLESNLRKFTDREVILLREHLKVSIDDIENAIGEILEHPANVTPISSTAELITRLETAHRMFCDGVAETRSLGKNKTKSKVKLLRGIVQVLLSPLTITSNITVQLPLLNTIVSCFVGMKFLFDGLECLES